MIQFPPEILSEEHCFIYIFVSAWQQRSAWLPYNKCAGEDTLEWLWTGGWRRDHSEVVHISEETPAGGGDADEMVRNSDSPQWEFMVMQCGEFCVVHMLLWKNTKALWYQGFSTTVYNLCLWNGIIYSSIFKSEFLKQELVLNFVFGFRTIRKTVIWTTNQLLERNIIPKHHYREKQEKKE